MNTKLPNFGGTQGGGNDSKYFQTTKKGAPLRLAQRSPSQALKQPWRAGEIHELREELSSPKMEKKKETVKKVIAAMTVGKDVSMLFTDVVNCIQTPNIELKKLVYLYLINYAKSQPDLAILAVNTFVRDTQDPNPLIRALAVRTMGCIRVDKIVEYLCEPLRKCLKDEDPYVRKTAAVCVAKLYDINGELVEDQGFLDMVSAQRAPAAHRPPPPEPQPEPVSSGAGPIPSAEVAISSAAPRLRPPSPAFARLPGVRSPRRFEPDGGLERRRLARRDCRDV